MLEFVLAFSAGADLNIGEEEEEGSYFILHYARPSDHLPYYQQFEEWSHPVARSVSGRTTGGGSFAGKDTVHNYMSLWRGSVSSPPLFIATHSTLASR